MFLKAVFLLLLLVNYLPKSEKSGNLKIDFITNISFPLQGTHHLLACSARKRLHGAVEWKIRMAAREGSG